MIDLVTDQEPAFTNSHTGRRHFVFYKSEPIGHGEDRGGFWLMIENGGRPDIPGQEDYYSLLDLNYRGAGARAYLGAAARLYRRLKTAGRIGPYQTFLWCAMGGQQRDLTAHEMRIWALQIKRDRHGTYYPRFGNIGDDRKATLDYAIEAYGFLCPFNGMITFKRWARAITEYSNHPRSREVSRVILGLYQPTYTRPIGRNLSK